MRIPRFLKISLILIISLLILLLGAGMVIAYFYEDEVKQLLVGQINKQLVTPVAVKNIELSLIKKFPNATLVFTDVTAESVQPADSLNDPEHFSERLFEAHKIFLQFNLLDIFHKKYDIKKIDIEQAKLNILINKSGNDNFHFWKKSSDTSATTFKINLENITVRDADIVYKNEKAKHMYSFVIKESELSGNFSESNYSLLTRGDYYVDEISIDNTNYLKRKSVLLEGTLNVSHNEKFEIEKVQLKLNELVFDLNGWFTVKENENNALDLSIKGKNLDIKTLISLLPDAYRKSLNSYNVAIVLLGFQLGHAVV